MTNISNIGTITINRGDTLTFPFTINVGTGINPIIYTLSENSKLYLGVMHPNDIFENAIIKKVYTADSEKDSNGNVIITFNPEDTVCLCTGKYYYAIKLQVFVNGKQEVHTVQENEFWIVE